MKKPKILRKFTFPLDKGGQTAYNANKADLKNEFTGAGLLVIGDLK